MAPDLIVVCGKTYPSRNFMNMCPQCFAWCQKMAWLSMFKSGKVNPVSRTTSRSVAKPIWFITGPYLT